MRIVPGAAGTRITFAFDVANQLETEETTSGITTFTFDANGNTYVEDAGGDLTTYTWSIDNMCLGIALPNATLNTFAYDADLKRRQEDDSAGVAKFIIFPFSLIFSSCLECSTFPKSFPAKSSGNPSAPKKVIHLAVS